MNGELHNVTGRAKNDAGRAHHVAGAGDCCDISGHNVDGTPHSAPHGDVPTAMSDAMFPFDDSMVRCFHQTREQEAKPILPGRSPISNRTDVLRLIAVLGHFARAMLPILLTLFVTAPIIAFGTWLYLRRRRQGLMITRNRLVPSACQRSAFSIAAWLGLVIPIATTLFFLSVIALSEYADISWPPRSATAGILSCSLLVNACSFLAAVFSLFGIPRHGAVYILWRAVPGLCASAGVCFFNFFCIMMGGVIC